MTRVLPIFKSHHSIGRSILTLEKKGGSDKNGTDSIVDIAVEEKLDKVFLIDSGYSGQVEASKNLAKEKIKLFFGVELFANESIDDKTEESLKGEHKINIIALNNAGDNKLKRIYSRAALLQAKCCQRCHSLNFLLWLYRLAWKVNSI